MINHFFSLILFPFLSEVLSLLSFQSTTVLVFILTYRSSVFFPVFLTLMLEFPGAQYLHLFFSLLTLISLVMTFSLMALNSNNTLVITILELPLEIQTHICNCFFDFSTGSSMGFLNLACPKLTPWTFPLYLPFVLYFLSILPSNIPENHLFFASQCP